MKKLVPTTQYGRVICSCVAKATLDKAFFFQITGQKKNTFNQIEYAILMNPDDIEMQLLYRYLCYLIYVREAPLSFYHFKYMNIILKKLENKKQKLEKQEKEQKEKVKKLVKKKK